MKILVTGACGYLGRGIVKSLLDLGADVVATDFNVDDIDKRAKKISCDLFSINDPYIFFDKPDVLLHLAWRDGFIHFSDVHISDLPKHYAFIKSFADSEVNTIAVLGTMHEIGFFEGCINEFTPCNPSTPYGISKNTLRLLTEMICSQKNKAFMWLRGYYIVGNTLKGASIFSKIVDAEYSGKKEFPFTHGQNQFDFVDYDTFCRMVAKSVLQTDITGIINVCSGHPEKLADRVERFIKDNNYSIKLKYGVFPERTDESKAVWGDSRKIDLIMNRE